MYGIPQNNVKRLFLLLRVRETLLHFSLEEEILCKYTCSYTLALCRLHIMSGVIHLVQTRYRVLSLDAGCLVLDRWIFRVFLETKIQKSLLLISCQRALMCRVLQLYLPFVEIQCRIWHVELSHHREKSFK